MLVYVTVVAVLLPAMASEYRHGDLVIGDPVIHAPVSNAPVAGGYLTIRNAGPENDMLIGVSAGFAGKSEIHSMEMSGEVMRMRRLKEGLEIPAASEVVLQPGGNHLMFMQLGERIKTGEEHIVRLVFERSGEVEIKFEIKDRRDHMHDHGHGDHADDSEGEHDSAHDN